jgi:hypothetical protein
LLLPTAAGVLKRRSRKSVDGGDGVLRRKRKSKKIKKEGEGL